MKQLIVAIESSCDDSSVAVFKGDKLLIEFTLSSILEQQKYGGIVPEVASREHLKNLHTCFVECIKNANLDVNDIQYVVYTEYPGLPGSLHVGILFAKMISKILGVKCIPVNHLCGHIFSAFINKTESISYPFLSLIVSGGNSIIYKVDSPVNYQILNETVDDAIGEVYDKVARALGWKYPGGPIIDKNYDVARTSIKFLKKIPNSDLNFSFSGLKTAVLNYINSKKMKNEFIDDIAIASSFQKIAIDLIIDKVNYYLKHYNLDQIVLGGGVSANKLLRIECMKLAKNVWMPEIKYTGDNAAMIGNYGVLLISYNKNRIK